MFEWFLPEYKRALQAEEAYQPNYLQYQPCEAKPGCDSAFCLGPEGVFAIRGFKEPCQSCQRMFALAQRRGVVTWLI